MKKALLIALLLIIAGVAGYFGLSANSRNEEEVPEAKEIQPKAASSYEAPLLRQGSDIIETESVAIPQITPSAPPVVSEVVHANNELDKEGEAWKHLIDTTPEMTVNSILEERLRGGDAPRISPVGEPPLVPDQVAPRTETLVAPHVSFEEVIAPSVVTQPELATETLIARVLPVVTETRIEEEQIASVAPAAPTLSVPPLPRVAPPVVSEVPIVAVPPSPPVIAEAVVAPEVADASRGPR